MNLHSLNKIIYNYRNSLCDAFDSLDKYISQSKSIDKSVNDVCEELELNQTELFTFIEFSIGDGKTDLSVALLRKYCNDFLEDNKIFEPYCHVFYSKDEINNMYTKEEFKRTLTPVDYNLDFKYLFLGPETKIWCYLDDEFIKDIIYGIKNKIPLEELNLDY